MNKKEFEKRIGEKVSDEFFDGTVTIVYNFHPSISETNGKDEIANLWRLGKHGLLQSMKPDAEKYRALENEMLALNSRRIELIEAMNETKQLFGKGK